MTFTSDQIIVGCNRHHGAAELCGRHLDRCVVGLSTSPLDDDWAKRVESGTPAPSALRALQDTGIPTFGMLCPMYPDVLLDAVDALLDAVRPGVVEHVWADPPLPADRQHPHRDLRRGRDLRHHTGNREGRRQVGRRDRPARRIRAAVEQGHADQFPSSE